MSQHLRDARINMIYEGTNGIQALDLLARKVLGDGGKRLQKFGALIAKFAEAEQAYPGMAEFIAPLAELGQKLTLTLGANYTQDRKTVRSNTVSTDAFSALDLVAIGGGVIRNTVIAQQVGALVVEVEHHLLEVALAHLSMADRDARLGHQLGELL